MEARSDRNLNVEKHAGKLSVIVKYLDDRPRIEHSYRDSRRIRVVAGDLGRSVTTPRSAGRSLGPMSLARIM